MADPGVYVNNRSACSKASTGWSPAATPDPCVSPGPVVVPYPNTSKATDLKKGTTTVFIKNKMVSQKNKSYFSTSIGDEPATPGLSKGVATGVIRGKSYFTSWSQNVKFEGLAVNRHQDLMTHNHGSNPPNTPPFPFLDGASDTEKNRCSNELQSVTTECGDGKKINDAKIDAACKKLVGVAWNTRTNPNQATEVYERLNTTAVDPQRNKEEDATKAANRQQQIVEKDPCLKARRCSLFKYSDKKGCCPAQTGHHLISDASIKHNSNNGNCTNYNKDDAPVVCAEGASWSIGSHKRLHEELGKLNQLELQQNIQNKKADATQIGLDRAIDVSTDSFDNAFPKSGCRKDCIKAQLEAYYKKECNSSADVYLVGDKGRKMPTKRPRSSSKGLSK